MPFSRARHFAVTSKLSSATPSVVWILHTAEVIARDTRKPVVPREALVHERVVGAIEIEQAAVFADEAVEELFRLATHIGREVVVEIRIVIRIRVDLVDVLQPQPLRGEPRTERIGSRVRKHPARLLVERGL